MLFAIEDPYGLGPIILVLLGVACVIACTAEAIEKATAARKEKRREKEWDDLSKP